jgi:hypothetical protein
MSAPTEDTTPLCRYRLHYPTGKTIVIALAEEDEALYFESLLDASPEARPFLFVGGGEWLNLSHVSMVTIIDEEPTPEDPEPGTIEE